MSHITSITPSTTLTVPLATLSDPHAHVDSFCADFSHPALSAVCASLNSGDGHLYMNYSSATSASVITDNDRDNLRNALDVLMCDVLFPQPDPRSITCDKTERGVVVRVRRLPGDMSLYTMPDASVSLWNGTKISTLAGDDERVVALQQRQREALLTSGALYAYHQLFAPNKIGFFRNFKEFGGVKVLTLAVVAECKETIVQRLIVAAMCKKRRVLIPVGYVKTMSPAGVLKEKSKSPAKAVVDAHVLSHMTSRRRWEHCVEGIATVNIAVQIGGMRLETTASGEMLRLLDLRIVEGYDTSQARPATYQALERVFQDEAAFMEEDAEINGVPEAARKLVHSMTAPKTSFKDPNATTQLESLRKGATPKQWVLGTTVDVVEDSTHEFKHGVSELLSDSKIKEWAFSYPTSFLNTYGGVFSYGINDKGVVVGVDLGQLSTVNHAFNHALSQVQPRVPANWYRLDVQRVTSSSKAANFATSNWWDTDASSTATADPQQQTTTSTVEKELGVWQFMIISGQQGAPFYANNQLNNSAVWGRYLASTQPMQTHVLLSRLAAHLGVERIEVSLCVRDE
eukprot:PhM_4_TR6745/c0_g1_i1/m.71755